MTNERIARLLVKLLPKADLFDFISAVHAAAKKSAKVADDAGLEGPGKARVAGFARFFLSEKALENTAQAMNAHPINGTIPGTEVRIFQAAHLKDGVLIGVATIPSPGELPATNLTRRNLASILNAHWQPSLFETEPHPKIEVYALLIVCRDPANLSNLQEVAIAVVSAQYDHYLHYEPLEVFLKRYEPATEKAPVATKPKLKTAKAFVPPEEGGLAKNDKKKSG